jgi:hypothetical protein
MEKNCLIRHLFPGGNTTQGFYSFFDQILSQEEANHIICIKGGPGVGKSSLMKKIAKAFLDEGYSVEYHHCSSDPDSLDAIVIVELRVALMDATAPHTMDPKNPGAVDEILNLGQFWDEEKIKEYKDEIMKINKENGRLFNKAYGYLKAAGQLYTNYEKTALRAFEYEKTTTDVQEIIKDILNNKPAINKRGKERHLFGFGLTPKGILQYRDSLVCQTNKRYIIKEDLYSSSELIMEEIKTEITKRGINVLCLHSPIKVSKIEDIIIDELGIIISVDNIYHKYEFEYDYMLDLSNLTNKGIIEHVQNEVLDDINHFDLMLNKALSYIVKAKANHDVLEKYYVDHMDFSRHDDVVTTIINKIKKYE